MQKPFAWPAGVECAVSLTYDDGLPVHYQLVAPLLERNGLRAAFYPMVQSDLWAHPEEWRALAQAGHELGNHTLFHPCRRTAAGQYPWLAEEFNLCGYSPARLRIELEVANFVLRLLDGQSARTYGNTCCDTTIGSGAAEQPIDPILADLFVAARGALTDMPAEPARGVNLLNVGCISADGRPFDELAGLVEDARARGGWAVLMIHGVGAETHELHLDPRVHERFVAWLAQQQGVWAAPFREVASYVRQAGG
jgi:sialate O-acetylesterase